MANRLIEREPFTGGLVPGRTGAASRSAVVQTIEEDIIFGRLRPRERLVEDDLMQRLGVKRHVVRQALDELQRLGIVHRERNKGCVVREFSVEEVEQIYEVREILHAQVAERIPLPVSPVLLTDLEAIHVHHSKAVDINDLRAVYRLNNEFHDRLFGACANPHLSALIAHYGWLAHAIRSYRIADPSLLRQARDEHGEMIEALRRGDRKELIRLCVDHIHPSKEAYLAAERQLLAATVQRSV